MKLIKTLSYLLIISLTFASYAEAKGKSFGGGFRSQRTAPAPQRVAPKPQATPAAQATQTKSMFGSFGTKPNAAAPQNAKPLNMSKDLNTNTAQGNALKTNDGRNTTAASTNQNTGTGWFRSGSPSAAQPAAMSTTQPSAMQQRGGGGGFMNGVMWFMLGSSLASNSHANQAQQVQKDTQNADATTGNKESSAVIDPLTGMSTPVEEKESFFMSVLRIVLWGAIIFGLYKLITFVMRARHKRANEKPNYSFGEK